MSWVFVPGQITQNPCTLEPGSLVTRFIWLQEGQKIKKYDFQQSSGVFCESQNEQDHAWVS